MSLSLWLLLYHVHVHKANFVQHTTPQPAPPDGGVI